MKFTRDYQLVYEGENDTGNVAKRNLRDYFIIINSLPEKVQAPIERINQEHMVDSLLRSNIYDYTGNYTPVVREVNDWLAQHKDEISDPSHDLLGTIQLNLFHDHLAMSRVLDENDTLSGQDYFNTFESQVHGLFAKHPQSAIYRLINRYGVDNVDRHLAKRHIARDDHMIYTYRGIYDDEKSDSINYSEIEEAMYGGEYGAFAPKPSWDAEHLAEDYNQLRIVSLWKKGQFPQALQLISKTYDDDTFEEVLEDFEVIDRQGLLENLQDMVKEHMNRPDNPIDDWVVALVERAQTVQDSDVSLWNIEHGMNHARPLDARNVLELVQEMADRIQE